MVFLYPKSTSPTEMISSGNYPDGPQDKESKRTIIKECKDLKKTGKKQFKELEDTNKCLSDARKHKQNDKDNSEFEN